jgi:hypothetical protein
VARSREKGTFKKWNRSDLLPNDRVFTSRYVYKIKRSAKTGEAYRFKARMIVRGFEMEKGVDYVDNFSPTPGLAVARLMMSLAIANDMELHKIDIVQALLQADKGPRRHLAVFHDGHNRKTSCGLNSAMQLHFE